MWFLLTFARQLDPLIGIPSTWDDDNVRIAHSYPISVSRGGGIPVILPVTTNATAIDLLVERLDGILLPGGIDVDPQRYGAEPLPGLLTIVPTLDDFQFKVIDAALKWHRPIFGICRGHEVLNAYFNGTLIQDIPTELNGSLQHTQKANKKFATHSVSILDGTNLRKILGQSQMKVNSFHHQAIRDLAPGFKVTAIAKDGIIEGIENIEDPRIYSVQWHPEGLVGAGDDDFLPLFQYLVSEAAKVMKKRFEDL
jgi:putative glutamine amidotransferase